MRSLLSSLYMRQASRRLRWLFMHWMPWAFNLELASVGSRRPASMAMMAMTTRSSIRVKAGENEARWGQSQRTARTGWLMRKYWGGWGVCHPVAHKHLSGQLCRPYGPQKSFGTINYKHATPTALRSAFAEGHVRARLRADVFGGGADEAVVAALFDDVRGPAGDARDDKDRREHRRGNAAETIGGGAVEIEVWEHFLFAPHHGLDSL